MVIQNKALIQIVLVLINSQYASNMQLVNSEYWSLIYGTFDLNKTLQANIFFSDC